MGNYYPLAELACGNFGGNYFVDRRLRLAIVYCEIAKAISTLGFCQLRMRTAPAALMRP
jgi:hypothetical protein